MAKQKTQVRGVEVKTQVRQAPKKGLNNLRCGCGGVLQRDGKGAMRCTKCRTSKVETPL